MNILVLGAGSMGTALANQFSRAGHDVRIAATSLEKATAVAATIPGATPIDAKGSAADCDVIVVATPFEQAVAALQVAGPVDGSGPRYHQPAH